MEKGIQSFREKLIKSRKFAIAIKCIIASLFSLYVFVFCSFGSRPKLFLISYPVLGVLTLALSIFVFVNYEEVKKKLSLHLLIPFVFVLFVLISTIIGTKNFTYLKTTLLLTITSALAYLTYVCVKDLKLIIYLICAPILLFGIYYCVHYRADILHYTGQRLGSFFGNENDVGLNLFFGFVLSTILIVPLKQYWMIPSSLLLLFSGITTGSKKVIILAFLFIIFLICVLLRKRKWLLIISLAAIVTVLVIVISLPMFADIRKRLLSSIPFFGNLEADASTVNRLLFFKSSFYLGTKSFIFGYGGSGFAQYSGLNVYSHNNLGEILCDFGALGVISFYALYPVIGFFSNKKETTHILIIFTFLGSFIFCSFTAVFFDSKIYYVLFALSLYLISDKKKEIVKHHENVNTYCEISV